MASYMFDFIEGKEENRLFQKKCFTLTLKYFLLAKNNYDGISDLYTAMNLFDNQRLLKMLQQEQRGTFTEIAQIDSPNRIEVVDEEVRLNLSFSSIIYEDIISLAAEEIIWKHNNSLWECTRELLNKHITLDNDTDIKYKNYYDLFLCLYNEEIKEIDYDWAEDVYLLATAGIRNSSESMDIQKLLIKISGGKDITDYKEFKQLYSDVIDSACKYVGVKNEREFFEQLRKVAPYARINYNEESEKNPLMMEMDDLLTKSLKKHNYGKGVIRGTAPVWTDNKIKETLVEILCSNVMNIIAEQKHNLFLGSQSDFFDSKFLPPIQVTIVQLIHNLQVDCILCSVDDLVKNYYTNFNFDKINNLETIKTMKKELFEARTKQGEAERMVQALRERSIKQEKLLKNKQKDINLVIREEMVNIEKAKELLQEENNSLKERLRIQDDYIKLLEQPEEEISISEIDYAKLAGNKFLFVGGREEVIHSLMAKFPSSIYTSNETETVNLSNVNYIVMFTKYMSHALYYKYINAARELGLKVIYCSNSNINIVLNHIQNKID